MVQLALSLLVIAFLIWYNIKRKASVELPASDGPPMDLKMGSGDTINSPLVYFGQDLHFSDEVIHTVLTKHLRFYSGLMDFDQAKFRTRLKRFIETKTFIIHDKLGFREMPILISASAIQLTLGLKKFALSHFSVIQVYPREFVGLEPFRILMGNVTGNTINIAWTHFLEGYKNGSDSQNVGLHEMAHALYYQNFESEVQVDREFRTAFPAFQLVGKSIFEQSKLMMTALYSIQAVESYQEFWAESIEIFFENPSKMMRVFPELYAALSEVLNQDPLSYPVDRVN